MQGVFPDSDSVFRLKNVNSSLEGKTFAELNSADQLKLKDSVLRATIVDQIDPQDDTSIFHIFERLNTGGTSLTPQEIRNCMYHGLLNDLFLRLNHNNDWRQLLGKKTPDNRLRDIELMLRFIALYYNHSSYAKPLKDFLSRFMNSNRFGNMIPLKEIETLFCKVVKVVLSSIGPKPFNIKAGLNAAVFDSVMVSFAEHVEKIPKDIKKRFERLKSDTEYLIVVSKSTTDDDVVRNRIKLANEILFKK